MGRRVWRWIMIGILLLLALAVTAALAYYHLWL